MACKGHSALSDPPFLRPAFRVELRAPIVHEGAEAAG